MKDIGFREIAADQPDDIKRGQQALEEMGRAGMLPPALEDKVEVLGPESTSSDQLTCKRTQSLKDDEDAHLVTSCLGLR